MRADTAAAWRLYGLSFMIAQGNPLEAPSHDSYLRYMYCNDILSLTVTSRSILQRLASIQATTCIMHNSVAVAVLAPWLQHITDCCAFARTAAAAAAAAAAGRARWLRQILLLDSPWL
jgi:hypothetical protein